MTRIDVAAWIPDPARFNLTSEEATKVAHLAEQLQSEAHPSDEEVDECCGSDCWNTHLDDAIERLT